MEQREHEIVSCIKVAIFFSSWE